MEAAQGGPGLWWGGEPTARGKRLSQMYAVCEPQPVRSVYARVRVVCQCALTARGKRPVCHTGKRVLMCTRTQVSGGLHTRMALWTCVSAHGHTLL